MRSVMALSIAGVVLLRLVSMPAWLQEVACAALHSRKKLLVLPAIVAAILLYVAATPRYCSTSPAQALAARRAAGAAGLNRTRSPSNGSWVSAYPPHTDLAVDFHEVVSYPQVCSCDSQVLMGGHFLMRARARTAASVLASDDLLVHARLSWTYAGGPS